MAQGRLAAGILKPADPGELDGEAVGGSDIWHSPVDWSADRLDGTNREIVQTTRGMLTRIIDLLK
jgi:hypothetical protein